MHKKKSAHTAKAAKVANTALQDINPEVAASVYTVLQTAGQQVSSILFSIIIFSSG